MSFTAGPLADNAVLGKLVRGAYWGGFGGAVRGNRSSDGVVFGKQRKVGP